MYISMNRFLQTKHCSVSKCGTYRLHGALSSEKVLLMVRELDHKKQLTGLTECFLDLYQACVALEGIGSKKILLLVVEIISKIIQRIS